MTFCFGDIVFQHQINDNESISMNIDESNQTIIFQDDENFEVFILNFDESELNEMKSFAFECKKISKQYNDSKTTSEKVSKIISAKLLSLSSKKNIDYGEYNNSYCKITELNTKKYEKNAGTKKTKDINNKLAVWSFTDELQDIIDNYYRPGNTSTEVEYRLIPTDQFPSNLEEAIKNQNYAPDVFALEDYFVRQFIEKGDEYLLDLTDLYNSVKNKMLKSQIQTATYKGKVYAMSWSAYTGAVFYRRSLARKYLGTDDPKEIQKLFSDFDSFLQTARVLKQNSDGKCVIVSSTEDLLKPFLALRKQPWIVNNKFIIDDSVIDYMKICKTMKRENLEGHARQWTEGWFAGMKDELRDDRNNKLEVFSYFLPTWGLHYVLKPNAYNTAGDWYMIQGPSAWEWGGTWIAAAKNTKNPNLAKNLIKYICTDDFFLEQWAKNTGDLVTNTKVLNKIKDQYSEPYLNGQNHYENFAEYASKVTSLKQSTDQEIENIFNDYLRAYLNNELTLETALTLFKDKVNSIYIF